MKVISFIRKRSKVYSIIILSMIVLSSLNSQEAGKSKFIMAFGYSPNENTQYLFLKDIYNTIFQKMNLEFSYEVLPLKRCSIETNEGKFDGEPLRVKNYNEKYENLLLVNEPIFENYVKAYSLKKIEINGWDSLHNINKKICYISGSVNIEQKLLQYLSKDQIVDVKSPEQAFLLLRSDRIDVFIDIEGRVVDYLQMNEFKDLGIHDIGILERHYAYPFVYKKWKQIIPKMEEIIREIKEDGTYKSVISSTIPYYIKYYTQ